MDAHTPTVEMSLDVLSEAVGKASDDLRAVRGALDRARADIAAHNTSISREVVAAAARAVDHLKQADQALKDVLQGLAERD
jgi:alkylation response protein AidB-like acyl-CoA dehydrogenase